jgi:hypothetical protein
VVDIVFRDRVAATKSRKTSVTAGPRAAAGIGAADGSA